MFCLMNSFSCSRTQQRQQKVKNVKWLCFAFTRKPRRTFDVRAHNKIICFIRQRKLSPAARGESDCIDEVIERLSDIRSVYPLMTDLSRECCVVLPTANI